LILFLGVRSNDCKVTIAGCASGGRINNVSAAMTAAQLWAILAAPFCALFAVRAALSARFDLALAGGAIETGVTPSAWRGGAPALSLTTATVVALTAVAVTAPSAIEACVAIVVFAGLAYLAIVDLRFMVVPVRLTLALAAAGVACAGLSQGARGAILSLAAALTGWVGLRAVDLIYQRLRGRSGLGAGDALVAALIAAWMSLEDLAWSIAVGAALTLAVVAARARVKPGGLGEPFPLVPGMVVGGLIVFMLKKL
jgi:prepilin signal peptidase PulO-like enzyme (type II secretory pathway)